MAVIAVSGATSGLGLYIVEALQARGKYDIVILTRKDQPKLLKELKTRFVTVNYQDVASIRSALEANNVETVICTINSPGDPEPERNLIRAADSSQVTKRIIPSIFAGFPYPIKYPESIPAKSKAEAIKEVQKTSLKYTIFYNGIFLDFYGSEQFKSYVAPWPMFVDIANSSAAIPGTGDELIAFTHSSDLAKFVAAIMDLEDWPKESWVIGGKVTWKEFVKLAEDAKGSKFNVVYDSLADLEAGKFSHVPSYAAIDAAMGGSLPSFITLLGTWSARSELAIKPTHTLNEDFPEITPMTVKHFLELSWKGF